MAEIKALVPAMTSVNTPEGECILYATGGSPAGDAPFYRVFDGNPSTIGGWANNDVNGTGTKDAYIGYHFTKPIKCDYAEFRWGGKNDSRYAFGVKLQGSNDGTNWVDLSEPVDIQMKTDPTIIESTKPNTYFTYLCIRYVSYSTISNIGYPQANEIQFYGTDDPSRIKSSGSTEAIRDWLNASLYNKEEIDELFIRNNQSGLIPYDLMITGDQPGQMIKLVGQTSGKTYNICLAAILGGTDKYCYYGLLWFGQGEDVKIFDSDSGKELLEHTLSERKDEIELPILVPKHIYGQFISAAQGSNVRVNCGFEPKCISIVWGYPASVIYTYGFSPETTGTSRGNSTGAINPTSLFFPTIDSTGFNFRSNTAGWANKTCYYFASNDIFGTFNTPNNINDSINIVLGFRPTKVAIRMTNGAYHWVYNSDLTSYPYQQGEKYGYSDDSRNPITITNNGFTFTPKNSYQQNKEVVYFAA